MSITIKPIHRGSEGAAGARAKGEGQHLNRNRNKADMADADKQKEMDAKKAEVRARLEAQAAGKKNKKGFMTPERKKKLRLLLRKKAAEELKKEQERKAAERRKVIDERCGQPKDLESASEDELEKICQDYFLQLVFAGTLKIFGLPASFINDFPPLSSFPLLFFFELLRSLFPQK